MKINYVSFIYLPHGGEMVLDKITNKEDMNLN